MDNDAFEAMIKGCKEVQEQSNNGDWLMNQFLKNSFSNCTQSEAFRRLEELENR